MQIQIRDVPLRAAYNLEQAGLHPLLAKLFAARGISSAEELNSDLSKLLPPNSLLGIDDASELLIKAFEKQSRICFVADYDCDGATACATGVRGLKMLGFKNVDYLVPDRITDGYGLTSTISQRVKERGADLLITVDNGIASIDGVAAARKLGLEVLVTDHHLPAEQSPNANAIVNPNQKGCTFESKSLAGVGVIFYVLMALRAKMRERSIFKPNEQPRLDTLLPIVALGTVADVVKLDANNRRLVAQGLKRIRKGQMPIGMNALFQVASRQPEKASTFDFGFALGPRINAAGRLSDMTIGIELLLTEDATKANDLAHELDQINKQRREKESTMREHAFLLVDQMYLDEDTPPAAIAVFGEDFHEGVSGIVASRIKDKLHRPTFVFAPSGAAGSEELKGSGRSIPGFHLRDALDLIAKRCPDIIIKFGGHAMAAGCSIHKTGFEKFKAAFETIAQELLDEETLTEQIQTDGALKPEYIKIELAQALESEIWGQGFPPPIFSEELEITSQRLVGEGKHLSLKINHHGKTIDSIWFGQTEPINQKEKLAYKIEINNWGGEEKIKFVIQGKDKGSQKK